jgi:hypothetical protein
MSERWQFVLIAVLTVALTVGRLTLVSHVEPSVGGTYTAFAHLIVGGMIGAWLVTRKQLYGLPALFLSAVELLAFFVTRGK